jgi:DNA-binding MarR family transcriptional regulator
MRPEDQIAELVFHLSGQLTAYVSRAVAEFGLTEPQALLIRHLREPLRMGTVADRLHCDASNLTGIVDRLESRGIVERRAVTGDRRARELVLTEVGRDLQERLDETIGAVPGLSDMSPDEQQDLMRLLGDALDRLLRPPAQHSEDASPG